MEVIVADNASTDDTAVWLAKNFPSVKLLQLEKNFGFAEGYNQAIARIGTEYVVLLNQDVETSGDWISPLVDVLETNPNAAAVQPKIKAYKHKDKFEYAGAAGGYIDFLGYPFCRGRLFDTTEVDTAQYDSVQSVAWASGACMLVRRSLYLSSGGLDKDLFAHMEEIDLCWRLKNFGYDILCQPAATVYHLGGGSLPKGDPKKMYLNFRNNLALLAKNHSSPLIGLLFVRFWLDLLAALRFAINGSIPHALAVIKAVFDFYKDYGKWMSKRAELKKSWHHPNRNGFYRNTILWDFHARKARTFQALRW